MRWIRSGLRRRLSAEADAGDRRWTFEGSRKEATLARDVPGGVDVARMQHREVTGAGLLGQVQTASVWDLQRPGRGETLTLGRGTFAIADLQSRPAGHSQWLLSDLETNQKVLGFGYGRSGWKKVIEADFEPAGSGDPDALLLALLCGHMVLQALYYASDSSPHTGEFGQAEL
jgi:hypothetical protein